MGEIQEPLWERTLRRIQDIWPLADSVVPRNRFSTDLPHSDLPRLRKKIDSCLDGKGGEVSARSRAAELGKTYSNLNETGRRRFLELLATEYDVDYDGVEDAINRRREAESIEELQQAALDLRYLLEAPRVKLFKQFNELEEGVKFLVDLRVELIRWAREDSRLKSLDLDVYQLLCSWFDVGFLDLQQITWKTSAALLEKLIDYEAVHEIRSWDDLKHRLEEDRLCYAFFHPRMPDEPLIFVEVALVNGMSCNIHEVLDVKAPNCDPAKADTAIFYSISNCQRGLAGVSFGNFLIKRVVADLVGKMPNLKKFCTLSPIPGFLAWLRQHEDSQELSEFDESVVGFLLQAGDDPGTLKKVLRNKASMADQAANKGLRSSIMGLCAHYLVNARRGEQVYDRVANFHLTNGARIERINWSANLSSQGLRQSAGLMVNYLYDLREIEKNHELYRTHGEVPISTAVKRLLK
ncbi:malonyl-CoA decarboxylase domain-containing protein [Desulfopila inferna]|uniref:malonyl-CoA decarboxylase domain-containing protein n=1 Tax=Desulfopila inferna TaxID=468528 RepID=UPI0019666128|nr:malonyl-CoA decarboxylase family protein [Desulfopila inferna]MBM9604835.1 malonyl-CoA decarboxylase family protein [Desulfopila inferna]